MTGDALEVEKLEITGFGNPIAVGYYNYYFVFIPNLDVKLFGAARLR